MKLVALAFQELQDVQRLQRRQAGDVDLFQLVADLVPDLQLHVLGDKESYISYALAAAYRGMVCILS